MPLGRRYCRVWLRGHYLIFGIVIYTTRSRDEIALEPCFFQFLASSLRCGAMRHALQRLQPSPVVGLGSDAEDLYMACWTHVRAKFNGPPIDDATHGVRAIICWNLVLSLEIWPLKGFAAMTLCVLPPATMLVAAGILAALAGSSAASILSSFGLTSLNDRALMPDIASGCSTTGTASCGNTSAVSNLCCFESPGGLLLQTQFWDTSPSTGPSNSWTIHGLWPDKCDLTFSENCDPSRAYTGISSLLTAQGASSTLTFMETFWKDISGNDETFWEHEWATHGTCMSTLKPSCLPAGSAKGAEAVAFFQTVTKLFQALPTFTWLSNQGITPSSTTTHTLASLTAAIKAESGFTPSFDCSGSNLNAVAYYFHLRGSIIDGTFVQIAAPESGTCPTTGIKYPLKTGSPVTTTTTAGGGTSTGTPGTLPAKATIHASSTGGLLSLGTWSTQTLATYTLTGTTNSFTMTSSKGNCGVSAGTFACGSGVSLTTFSAVTSGTTLLLASGGSTAWTSDGVPSGTIVFDVFTGSGHADDYTLSIVSA
ncbi:ribonuclease T2-like protein [Mycena epipterygia]|nr:ribonuclease T2-like protein [Mycena epipterygia]